MGGFAWSRQNYLDQIGSALVVSILEKKETTAISRLALPRRTSVPGRLGGSLAHVSGHGIAPLGPGSLARVIGAVSLPRSPDKDRRIPARLVPVDPLAGQTIIVNA
jgi:hypothetical protein